jgi:DNA-binding Xre family transcriptional regulator
LEAAMIRLKVAEALERKGWTAYRLAREAKLTVPVAYRLAGSQRPMQRLDLETLDAVCAALGVQPGELLEWVPERKRR